MRLCVGHQHSQFLANSGRLVDYYSLFWGPGVISTIDEPLGAFTCRSSTLAGFVDSDPFRGLLLTVLGSQRDFHFFEPQGVLACWSSRLAVLADFGPFLNYYTVLASRSDFHD